MGYCDQTLMWQTNPPALVIMIYTNNISSGRGLVKRSGNPRLLGSIVKEMLHGNSPLARGYRKFVASKEKNAEKGGEL